MTPPRNLDDVVILREFLYRRDDLVSQFLAQLEGGVYDEERITEQDESRSGFGGSLSAGPAGLSGERGRLGSSEAERTVRQTAESQFNRLRRLLDKSEAIQFLSALDDDIWTQLDRNEIVEVDAAVRLAPGVADMSNLSAVGEIAPWLELMRTLPPSMLPDDYDPTEADLMSNQLSAIEGVAERFATAAVPCIFSPAGSPRYQFFAELPREHLLVEPGALEGELSVLAKIQRFVLKGKPETLGSGILPGMSLNREQRRTQKADEQPMTVRLSFPAAVATVIAIYR